MNRKKRVFVTYLTIILIGVIYYIFISLTDLALPCIFRQITGYKCPGCGITTSCVRTLHGNLSGAFHANPFLFVTFPFLLFQLVYQTSCYIKEKPISKLNRILLCVYVIALLVFGVVRNIQSRPIKVPPYRWDLFIFALSPPFKRSNSCQTPALLFQITVKQR